MEQKPNRALARAVMLGLTALCLVTVGVVAAPAATATPPIHRECVQTSGTIDFFICAGSGDPGTD